MITENLGIRSSGGVFFKHAKDIYIRNWVVGPQYTGPDLLLDESPMEPGMRDASRIAVYVKFGSLR